MDNKKRIMTALKLGEPDRVPYFEFFNEESIVNVCKALYGEDEISSEKLDIEFYTDQFDIYDLLIKMTRDLDIDALISFGIPGWKKVPGKEGYSQDSFGNVYRESSEGEPVPVEGAVKEESDIKKVSKVRPEDRDFKLVDYFKKTAPERVCIYGLADPFKISWKLLGALENLLPLYINDPDIVHKLARVSTDFLIEEVKMAIDKGAEVLLQDGDWAETKNPFMSPKMFREFVKPYCAEINDIVHELGVPIIKHSDGNVGPILDDLIEAGYDAFHPVEPQSMDLAKVKKQTEGKICICGNIDCMYLLPYGKPEEVVEEVKKTLKIAAPGGGYICSSSNSVHPGVPGENAIAMVNAAHKYGNYPIKID
jgi:uroporphyrinogen decarboxylase